MPSERPQVVLGIVDGLHDAGAALVRDGRIVAAANEERFTRVKLQGGMPRRSIDAVLATATLTYADVDAIAKRPYAVLLISLRPERTAIAVPCPCAIESSIVSGPVAAPAT